LKCGGCFFGGPFHHTHTDTGQRDVRRKDKKLPQEFLLFGRRFGCCASADAGAAGFFLYQLISAISIRLRAEKLLFWKSALAAGEIIYSPPLSHKAMEFRRLVWSFAAAGVWWKKALDFRDETVDSLELRISWFLQTRSSCALCAPWPWGAKNCHILFFSAGLNI